MFQWTGGSVQSPVQGSLLSDWNSYSQTATTDVEAGHKPQELLRSVGDAGSTASTWAAQQANLFSGHANTAWNALPGTSDFRYSIPSTQQLTYLFSFVAAGVVFLLLAFFLFLPVIILSPSKFALSFTLGCLFILVGFAQLRGWKQQLAHMFSQERLIFTTAYLGSIFGTLYAALWMHSYILSLVSSAAQVVALSYYVLSYFPGGTSGVRFLLGMISSGCWSCLASVQKLITG